MIDTVRNNHVRRFRNEPHEFIYDTADGRISALIAFLKQEGHVVEQPNEVNYLSLGAVPAGRYHV